ncbi:MAG: histidine--tRNA ligase [Bacteriovoracaceae bacterium]
MALSKSSYRGTRDFFPQQMRLRNFIFQKMSEVSELFAYEPYDGPLLEEVELYLAKSGEELINEQIYSFMDRGDRHVAIRPEMTPTLARMVAQIHREVTKPIRMYAIPNLMRYEKPQRGRLREFWQYNADIFGAGELGEIEIIQLAVAIIKSFGATSEHFEVLVNDRRFVDLVFEKMLGLGNEATKKLYKLVDAKNKMPADKFSAEIRNLTQDEKKAQIFEQFVNLKTPSDIMNFAAHISEEEIKKHVTPLIELFKKIEKQNLSEYVKFEPSIVRGLDYYTGIVFEIFDKHPENRRAIAGGGSYANLLQIFNETPLEGVGIGLGEVPLTDFLTTHKLLPDFSKADVDYLVAYLAQEGEALAMQVADRLRSQNKKVELFLGEAKPKKIFTYSEKKNFKHICFIGEEEAKNQTVKIKDLINKTETTKSITDL